MENSKNHEKIANDILRALLKTSGDNTEEKIKILEAAFVSFAMELMKQSEKKENIESDLKEPLVSGLLTRIGEAYEKYDSDEHKRPDQRARAFLNHLGITKRREKTNKKYMFYEYMELVYGSIDFATFKPKEALSKDEALEVLREKYGLSSQQACLEQLRKYTRKVKKQAEQEGRSCNFDNILPGRNPYNYK